ncbi:hypothetical protein B5728_11560 [Mammaliicoccus sciuri]|nr:hypothetical protein B5728_11560 [Mammaliicoccus sciuri]
MKIRKNLFLAYIDALQNRIDVLPENIDEQYQVTKQGYEGEKAFAQILESYGQNGGYMICRLKILTIFNLIL